MSVKSVVLGAVIASLITAQQIVLAPLPNVSLTAFLIIVFALILNFKTNLLMILVYLFSRNLFLGSPLSVWLLYFLVFGSLSIFCSLLKRKINNLCIVACIAFFTGIITGLVSGATELIIGGINLNDLWPYIIRGIPYDIVHGVSNVLIVIVLFDPVVNILDKQLSKYFNHNNKKAVK